MASPDTTITYLVEMMDPHLVTLQKVDVTVFLANAVETVLKHFEGFGERIDVEVTIDEASGDLAGIVFYNEEAQAIAVIRPYYLHRDALECTNPDILSVAGGPVSKLEGKLNQLFKQR